MQLSTYLSPREEAELVTFLSRCTCIGYAKSHKEVLVLVQRVLDRRGLKKLVTNGWWESFRHRHPNLTLRTAVPLSLARARASDPEMLPRYFDLLEQTLQDNDLKENQVKFVIWTRVACHSMPSPLKL